MKLSKLSIVVPLAAAAAALALSGCGARPTAFAEPASRAVAPSSASPSAPESAPGPTKTATPAPSSSSTPLPAPPKEQILTVVQLKGWMPFVTNDKGRTIYRFDKDSANPSKTTCLGQCAKTWEPVLAGPGGEVKIRGGGLDKDLVGTIDRPEGKQVTLKGWPLYYFKDDKTLGQTAGHGVKNDWFAIAPNGQKSCRQW